LTKFQMIRCAVTNKTNVYVHA